MKDYNLVNEKKDKNIPFGTHFINFLKTISYEVNLTSQCSHLELLLISKVLGLEGGIFNDADSGPRRYVLSCCSSICLLKLLTEEILSITASSDRGSYAKPL